MNLLYTLLPLHRAFHEARAWSNSKYEDNNEILYHPSIVPGGGTEQVWGGSSPPVKPPLFPCVLSSDCSEEGSGGGLRGIHSLCEGMPHVHHPTFYASATRATSSLMDQTQTAEE